MRYLHNSPIIIIDHNSSTFGSPNKNTSWNSDFTSLSYHALLTPTVHHCPTIYTSHPDCTSLSHHRLLIQTVHHCHTTHTSHMTVHHCLTTHLILTPTVHHCPTTHFSLRLYITTYHTHFLLRLYITDLPHTLLTPTVTSNLPTKQDFICPRPCASLRCNLQGLVCRIGTCVATQTEN